MSEKWKTIQRAVGVSADGIPGEWTANAVAAKLGISFAGKPQTETVKMERGPEPPWMIEARKHVGLLEIPGPNHNPQILKWWEAIKVNFVTDEVPWCSGFVGGCLEAVGIRSTRSAAARSYAKSQSFAKLSKPAQGCVVVFWRGSPTGWSGHVAFLAGIGDGAIWCLGGNQGDKVSIAKFSPGRLFGYYWPHESTLKPDDFPPRRMNASGAFSTNEQ
jgi:uncharacterized protein (TIGR02594 family)